MSASPNSNQSSTSKQTNESDFEDSILGSASDIAGLFHVIKFGKGVYWRLMGALSLILASSIAVMGSARIMGSMASLLSVASDIQIGLLAAGFMSLETLSVILQYLGRVTLAHATIEITYRIRCELFTKIERLPIAYFDSQPLGRTITRVTADVEGIETFFNGTLARVLIALINLVTVLITMLLFDLRFGAFVLMASIPALISSVAFRRPVRHWLRTYKKRAAQVNAKLAENLSGLAVIKAFGLEEWSKKEYDREAAHMRDAGLNTMNWNSLLRPLALLLCSVPTLMVLWYGGQDTIAGSMTLGTLVAFVRLSERFVSPIRTLSQEIQNIQEALVSSERVRKMLQEPEEQDVLGPDGTLSPDIHGHVEFKNISMRYGPKSPWALRDVSFVVRPGMKVGLVGASGSGKSTTLNLLPRFYPFEAGEILIDNVPIQNLRRDHLRSQLGFVGQDTVITAGTIRSNLLSGIGRGIATSDEMLWAACERTGLDIVLNDLPDGLDQNVVEGGDNLSMGQRQLIALTRMLLRNPRIMILDEATANIDERAEKLVQAAVVEVMEGRTTFVIAHRLSTIEHCDVILVFRDGRIVEQGTHESLRSLGAYYHQLTMGRAHQLDAT